MRPFAPLGLFLVLALIGTLLTSAPAQPGQPPIRVPDYPDEIDEEGETCHGGCAAVKAHVDHLEEAELEKLIEALATQEIGEESEELDSLLYYWREAEPHLKEHGRGSLSEVQYTYLLGELARHAVTIHIRIIGDDKDTRIELTHRLTFGRRTHMHPDLTKGVQTPEITGTVQRVGLNHIWARF